jgi:protein O-GlcNAc transferase
MLLAYLMARVFELHDRTRFEVSAISIGINDSSAIRHRLECAFDKFVEASELNDFEIASKIRKDEIDLLIDRSSSLHRKDRLSPRHISSQRL